MRRNEFIHTIDNIIPELYIVKHYIRVGYRTNTIGLLLSEELGWVDNEVRIMFRYIMRKYNNRCMHIFGDTTKENIDLRITALLLFKEYVISEEMYEEW